MKKVIKKFSSKCGTQRVQASSETFSLTEDEEMHRVTQGEFLRN
jgi:hypothetical protein